MSLSKIKPTRKDPSVRRTLIYGTQGVGKSTFASLFPSPVFLPTEKGLGDIDAYAYPIAKTWTDFLENVMELANEQHDFKTVIVDTLDWAERLLHEHVCGIEGKPTIEECFGGYGKWAKATERMWTDLLKWFDLLHDAKRMRVVFLAHAGKEKIATPGQEPYMRNAPKCTPGLSALISEYVDDIGFATFETWTTVAKSEVTNKQVVKATGGTDRILVFENSVTQLAKHRVELPPQIEFTYNAYALALSQAVEKERIKAAQHRERTQTTQQPASY